MRHRKKFNHLGRKSQHRKLMLSNMACSLVLHKRIETTVAKAKALKMYVEPIITRSKVDSTLSRRVVFDDLRNKYAVTELFENVAPKIMTRPGGYTRIVRLATRMGDGADMCLMELVDFNETYSQAKGEKRTTRRTRRSSAKRTETPVQEVVASEAQPSEGAE